MAVLNITIPDAIDNRILNRFTDQYGYQATVPDPANPGQTIPNPENRRAFMKKKVMEFIKETVKAREATLAGETARRTAADAAETDIILS